MSDRIEVFKKMLGSDSDNPLVLFGLANEYLKAENFSDAATTFEKYLAHKTDEGAAYGMLAKAYEALGENEKAKLALKKGIEVSLANGHPSMAEDYQETLDADFTD